MSAILEGNIGHGGLPILDEDHIPKNNTTDYIAEAYRKHISQSISSKILKYSKTLLPPVFTQEELAFIKKDAEDNDPTAEVKVITPDPTITLKKGNTEINIKNAATLVKKMEAIYPNPNRPTMSSVESNNFEFSAPPPIIPPQPDIKTVNKNAYEIRTDVLGMALDWVKYQMDVAVNLRGNERIPLSVPSNSEVLDTAKDFYKFVENRR